MLNIDIIFVIGLWINSRQVTAYDSATRGIIVNVLVPVRKFKT